MKLRNLTSIVTRADGEPAANIKIPLEHVAGSYTDTHTIPGRPLPAIETDEHGAFAYDLWPNGLGATPSYYRMSLFGKRIRFWIPDGEDPIELSQARVLAGGATEEVQASIGEWLTENIALIAGLQYTTGLTPEPEGELPPKTLYLQVDPIE